jgi:hypothetical protein
VGVAKGARAGIRALTWPAVIAVGLATGACGVAAGAGVEAAGVETGADADGTRTLFTIADGRITESSGLAASSRHAGVLYTHNDSGDAPRVYAIDPDGATRATLTLAGARARDWEGIATGRDEAGRPALFVGDIGDNLKGGWPSIAVYRVTEPARLTDATLTATRFRFTYADGARDAEALLVDPRTNRLYVVSKESDGGGLYQAPAKLRRDRVNVLRRVASVPGTITDGSFAPDGSRIVLRGYLTGYVLSPPGAAPARELGTFGLPLQGQGESATYSADGRHLLVGSEGAGSTVVRVALPPAAVAAREQSGGAPGGAGTAGGSAGPAAAGDDAGREAPGPRNVIAVALAAGASLLVVWAARRVRR